MALECRLALSSNSKKIDRELFRSFADRGIEAMEISASLNEYEKMDFGSIKVWAEEYNVRLWSFHLPFSPFDRIDISKPDTAGYTIELFKKYIKKANSIGIKIFVVHPSGEPIKDEERQSRMRCAKESLKQLAEYAGGLESIIAVEDLPRSCLGKNSAEIKELISSHEKLRVCCDTNHLLKEDLVSFLKNVGEKIITVHISDYDFINERHWLPGEGKIDWTSVVLAFEDIGYRGYWLYEIGFESPWSIERERALCCQDFKNNYDQLMGKKMLTKIGTPKKNLGMWSVLNGG